VSPYAAQQPGAPGSPAKKKRPEEPAAEASGFVVVARVLPAPIDESEPDPVEPAAGVTWPLCLFSEPQRPGGCAMWPGRALLRTNALEEACLVPTSTSHLLPLPCAGTPFKAPQTAQTAQTAQPMKTATQAATQVLRQGTHPGVPCRARKRMLQQQVCPRVPRGETARRRRDVQV